MIAGSQEHRSWIGRAAAALLAIAVAGCATVAPRSGTARRDWSTTAAGPFVIESGGRRPARTDAARTLEALHQRLDRDLSLAIAPDGPAIRVIILDDQEQLARLMGSIHPELPPRRAFFLAEGPRRTVYASRGDRLMEDLRHEATHAVLHAAVGPLPLWLDEGLAEYFEVEPGDRGEVWARCETLARARAGGWRPDLSRLESISSIRGLTARDYREAWAWTRMLLEGPEPYQRAFRRALARDRPEGTLAEELALRPEALEAAFWRSIGQEGPGDSPVLARSQSPTPTPPRPTPAQPPRSRVARFFDRIGSALFGP